jgi:hypothetical protein
LSGTVSVGIGFREKPSGRPEACVTADAGLFSVPAAPVGEESEHPAERRSTAITSNSGKIYFLLMILKYIILYFKLICSHPFFREGFFAGLLNNE